MSNRFKMAVCIAFAVFTFVPGVMLLVRGCGIFVACDAPPVPAAGTRPNDASPFLKAGEWITTIDGRRVCRNRWDLYWYHPLNANFCDGRQPGFLELHYGMLPPVAEGWVRLKIGGGIQLHTERGWVP